MRLLACALAAGLAAAGGVPPMPEGHRAMHSLDHERAIRIFEREAAERPDDPEAWNHLAHALLHRAMYSAGAFDTAAFGPGSPFLKRPKVPMSEADQARFAEGIRRPLGLCGERLARNPGDRDCLYAEGVAHAHQAQMALFVKKSWREALRGGTKSRHVHEHLMRPDPEMADARLMPGMHDYIAGSLPWYARALALLAGIRGAREQGIAPMEQAVARGRKPAVEARAMLAVVMRREKNCERAAGLMGELAAAFPAHHLHSSEEIRLLAEAGRAGQARAKPGQLRASGLLGADKIEALSRSVEEILGRQRRRKAP